MSEDTFSKMLEPLCILQQETNTLIRNLQRQLMRLEQNLDNQAANGFSQQSQMWIILGVVLMFQTLLQWFLR